MSDSPGWLVGATRDYLSAAMAGFDFRSVGWVLDGRPQGIGHGSVGEQPAAPGAMSKTHALNLSASGRTSAATCPSCA